VDDLGHADIGEESIRRLFRDLDAEVAAPGMAEEQDAVLPEAVAQVVRHLDRVRNHLRHGHRLGRDVGREGHPGTALLPPDHGEMAFQARGIVLFHEELGHSGAAVQKQEHRVRRIDALDDHALRDTADLDGDAFG
jgi:hypothetical protein